MEKKNNSGFKKETILIFLGMFLFFANFVGANPPPPALPDHFIGNVSVYGNPAPVNTTIEVYLNSELVSVYNISEKGEYDLYVKKGNAGDTVEFKINDKLAGSSTRQGGEIIYLNLEVTKEDPDDSDGSEDSSGGSSGGGSSGGGSSGGGGSFSVTTTSDSNETNDTLNNSNLSDTPENLNETQNSTDDSKNTEENKNSTTEQRTSPGITGAAVGFVNKPSGKITIAFIALIGALLIKFRHKLKNPQSLKKWRKSS